MNVYKLDSDANNFQAYLHETTADLEILDMIEGIPIAHRWRPPRLELHKKRARRGDYPCIFYGSCVPVFSQRALDVLFDLLIAKGEILPLFCDVEPLYAYNCTRIADVLDEDRSDIFWADDMPRQILGIDAYAWKPTVCDETLFRLPRIHHSGTYITEVVAERIRSAGLRGFDLVRC